jgi:hypothetical protein
MDIFKTRQVLAQLEGASFGAMLFLFGTGCAFHECSSENDSASLLRAIPIGEASADQPSRLQNLRPSNDPDAEDASSSREGVSRQTYTLGTDGELTLSRSVEKRVGFLGMETGPLDYRHAKRLDMEPFTGVRVRSAERDGPASRAGIKSDDVIVSFAGEAVSSPDRLKYLIEQAEPGKAVEVQAQRKKETLTLSVQVGHETLVESSRALQKKLPVLDDRKRTGLKLAEVTEDVRPVIFGSQNADKGLLVLEILPGGPAFFSPLHVRDQVIQVGSQPVSSLAEYSRALDAIPAGTAVTFTARRDGQPVEATLTIDDDALASSGFNALHIVRYHGGPDGREFSLLAGLLFNYKSCHSVRRREKIEEHYTSRGWGLVLDLIAFKKSPTRTELRLAWLFPITFRRS